MRIYTQEQLSDAIDEALAWRKVELSVMRRAIESATLKRENAMLRAALTLLYAHWEGFVKQAGDSYLNFVVHQRLQYRELASNFLGVAFRSKLEAMGATRKACHYTQVCDLLIEHMAHRATIPYKDEIDTGANLSSEVFRNILCLLGLEPDPYKPHEKPIIDELLNLRNRVAHGKWVNLDLETYIQFHEAVIDMVECLRDQIDSAATLGRYRRREPVA